MRFRPAASLCVVIAMLAAHSSGQDTGQRPPRDRVQRVPEAKASVGGNVVDVDTGLPLRRATVTLTRRASREDPVILSTDEKGRFDFSELASGDYSLIANAPGYVPLGLGQRRPFEPRQWVQVANGQEVKDLRLQLPRGGVIRGRVSDEFGQPVLGATVRAAQIQHSRGRRRVVPIGNAAQTDDLGQYRIYGLPSGAYVVSAQLRTTFAARRLDVTGYAPSYYPGTPVPEEASTVAVAVSAETPADITLNPVRLSSVAGVAFASSGRPFSSGRVIAVRRVTEKALPVPEIRSGVIASDGSFSITGLAPGEFFLSAQQVQESYAYPLDGSNEMAIAVLSVTGEDINNIALTEGPSGRARGRITIEGKAPRDAAKTLRIEADAPDGKGDILLQPVDVNPDLTFEVRGLIGRQLFGVQGADALKLDFVGVRFEGQDITDKGLDFGLGQARDGLEIVLTSKRTGLAGNVLDEGNRPAPAIVLAFAQDEALWALPTEAFLRRAKAGADGTFKLDGLRPAEYWVVGVDDFDMTTYGDPSVLKRLQSIAEPVTVPAGKIESVTLALRRP